MGVATGILDVVGADGEIETHAWNGNPADKEAARAVFEERMATGYYLAVVHDAPGKSHQVSARSTRCSRTRGRREPLRLRSAQRSSADSSVEVRAGDFPARTQLAEFADSLLAQGGGTVVGPDGTVYDLRILAANIWICLQKENSPRRELNPGWSFAQSAAPRARVLAVLAAIQTGRLADLCCGEAIGGSEDVTLGGGPFVLMAELPSSPLLLPRRPVPWEA